jgi:Protein of unknown function (DUF1573)
VLVKNSKHRAFLYNCPVKTTITAVTLSILLCFSARAELKWEQTQIELHPATGDKEAVGHFKYKNVGNGPVKIKSVHTSCGCTAAQSQKDAIAPGDAGEVTATFKIGDRTGTQVKGVTVETDDPTHPTVALVLTTVIPGSLEIQPALVYWKTGEEPKAKSVSAKAGKGFPVQEIKITPASADFETKVTKVSEGEFKIDIQPRDTTRPSLAVFTLQADKSPKIFRVTARVAAPAATKPTAAQP